jgi:hypothetical protein
MSATTAESPASIAFAQAVSRMLAMSVAIYLSLVYSVGYAILAWSVNNRLAPISCRGDSCGYEAVLLIGLLVFLVILPTALLWFGKIGQGLLAYGIGQFVALAVGLVFHSLLLARYCTL